MGFVLVSEIRCLSFEFQEAAGKAPRGSSDTMFKVPKRIFETCNTTKLVLIVRDPVARLVSDYNQFRSRHLERWAGASGCMAS